ncbi:Cell surface lipoprotein MPB83 precursor [Polystyrenella longa]|uniref:Cell surface lipoprotein MPB83 n=1 Tax=Polystyrenella longa TaxID=2528007 RepID=A0A518CSQ2_9PLAN|nr:fasciclin domain-containing protein [Polystyrenella longa]QDU82248.1 Cell surface lipoprotein MPB83 precursor [Polystyrenella longa]
MFRKVNKIAAFAVAGLLVCSQTLHAASKDIVTTAVEAGSFKTLAKALDAAGLVSTLQGDGPFTVFAPTDEAFAKLPEGTIETLLKPENKEMLAGILTYHVVSGKVNAAAVTKISGATTVNGQQVDIVVEDGSVMIDGAKVIKADIECTNGIIHVIDSVILPADANLVETAINAGSFKTLIAAAEAAGLAETLATGGPFTVFAPTDEAFDKLPEGTVESLLKPKNKAKLASILKYHVVSGRVYSAQAVKLGEAETLLGPAVNIKVNADGAMVNNAGLVATDIDASNGVIHVIDTVLMPPEAKTTSMKPADKMQADQMIEQAIATGSAQYNQGDHAACAQLYDNTAAQVLKMNPRALSARTYQSMQTALNHSRQMNCSTSQAWALRRALDHAYADLTETR